MKKWFFICLFVSYSLLCRSQDHYLDSLKLEIQRAINQDSNRVLALFSLADYYGFQDFDSCLIYAQKTIELSDRIKYPYGKYLGYLATFHALNAQANYAPALQAAINFKDAAQNIATEKPWAMSQTYYFFGLLNREMTNYEEAKKQFNSSIKWQQKIHGPIEEMFASFSQLGIVYLLQHRLDSALYFVDRGYELGNQPNRLEKYFPLAVVARGNVNLALGRYDTAKKYFDEAIQLCKANDNYYFQTRNYISLANLFRQIGQPDSAIFYARKSMALCRDHKFGENFLDASKILAAIYESRNRPDSALKYMKLTLEMKDSIFSVSKGQQFQQYAFNEIQQLQNKAVARERYQAKVRVIALGSGLAVMFIMVIIVYRSSVRRKRDKIKIEQAYNELKLTQKQLIQSEKMASLGELTAGIAHEIQNPLNFVNNFSEVSNELMDEMNEELNKGDVEEARAISNDIKQNLEKINHHGLRAAAIVKGMLQHSQKSTGQKELTDINALCDEYLRLSYHGFKAKEKNFTAEIKTDFDSTVGKINIAPQDIGRVMLNLFNNAFYAVNEKKKVTDLEGFENLQGPGSYEPAVSVSTKKIGDKMEIRVKDNGSGIPQKVVDKIFQPFFTTKPTGVGTGLGLSLSYDIIKAHGGEIKVETKEGEGSKFIIQLPVV